ncbi:hypothetical protein [Microbacterium sp.]|uniref:hypothetical protein n=1 Tax=Microbacterium sp. TaxID=51671 RepID=UPI0025ED0016|nr:hypothetical protein [Microbacterium sp.]
MAERQRIERVPGRRRAKLTPAPGTTVEPTPADETADAAASDPVSPAAASGPNDERMRRDVPPHY